MKTKFPRAAAVEVARELCHVLGQCTERLVVAGSLRRRKAEVGDVEILYIGQIIDTKDPNDLFGRKIKGNLTDAVLDRMIAQGRLAKRPNKNGGYAWGAENKLAVHVASGIPVDLFAATISNWFNLLVCRTGPAESNTQICMAAERRGWKWDPYSPGFLDRHTGALVHRTQSERDVFNSVGLVYVEPWKR